MNLLQIIWNYFPILVTVDVLAGHSTPHAEYKDYEDYSEMKGRLAVWAPYLTEPSSYVYLTVLGTTARPVSSIE